MNTEVKPRRVCVTRKRTARPHGRACPEQLADPAERTKSDTDKNMAAIFDLLRRKKNARLEHLVLNRESFAQTVENIFALSFLVKDGRVEINVNDEGHHIVYPRNSPAASAVASGKVSYNHFVFRFDFKDWKLMKGIVADGEELMLHRSSLSAPGTGRNNHPEPETPLATPGTEGSNHPEPEAALATAETGGNDHPDPEVPLAAPDAGGNGQPEPEVPLVAQGIPIRKFCRNRGLVLQDETTVAIGAQEVMECKMAATGAQAVMVDKKMAMDRKEINLTYKRRRLFQDD
uniref:Non-structural maintenance of chromosomes element 4 n=1 Tax=Arundo donax TaxID=35708 RepID=A0A0A9C6X4_ARUDO